MNGHGDTPDHMALHPNAINHLVSGSFDGEMRIWDLNSKKEIYKINKAHNGPIGGLEFEQQDGQIVFSCGRDKHLKAWKIYWDEYITDDKQVKPLKEYKYNDCMLCMSVNTKEPILATGGQDELVIWDTTRCVPRTAHDAIQDQVLDCAFSKTDPHLIAMSTRDRSIYLYDIRARTAFSRFQMKFKTNALCYNPYQPFIFTTGCEDYNCYNFDMRKLSDGPTAMYAGMTNAVTSIDYSPSGHEFVAGGYDNTIRIFDAKDTSYKAKDVYYTARMRRVHVVKYTKDAKFILSGSDDHGIRVWKAKADERIRQPTRQERMEENYNEALIKRYKDFKDISNIVNYHHLPQNIYNEAKQQTKHRNAVLKKEARKHRYTRSKKESGLIKKTKMMKRHYIGKRKLQ
eukprot:CAMPEP_0117424782 /NCGR_PEP_ID=MMETSP0758-20121206/5149_1 /TAXON_ID=63605 /ORGANISM="Percolomonas cosmopolitus, Strain AE-1 (ATCC 50343)" /LENGTH=399 /DNA_ID=CAMNT_0005208801 /DNA_START=184 /DNA_END=1386 /DNA_ORIENTATION=-